MTTATLQSAPEHADQKKQAVAADIAKPGAPDVAKPGAPDVAKPAAKPSWARRHRIVMIVSGVVLIAAAILIWKVFFAVPAIPDSIVVVSGRIEGDDSAIASKTTGRFLEVRVREGDSVNAGDTIAILDDAQIRAREDQARATLREEEAKADAAEEQIAVLREQLEQSRLQVGQSKFDTEGHMGKRRPIWQRRNPNWRSSRRLISLPRSIRTPIRASRNPERCRSARDCRPRPRPISRPR